MTTSDDQREAVAQALYEHDVAAMPDAASSTMPRWSLDNLGAVDYLRAADAAIAALSSRPALPAGDENDHAISCQLLVWSQDGIEAEDSGLPCNCYLAALASRPSSPQAGDERQHMQSLAKWVGVDESTPSLEIACEVSAALETRIQAADERGALIRQGRNATSGVRLSRAQQTELIAKLIAALESDGQGRQ